VTDSLVIAGKEFQSRLLVGTAKYPNQQILLDALATSGTEIVTVAIRRVAPANHAENLYDLLRGKYHLLPNTAGCYTARDAVLTAQLAREALQTNWIKLEVIGDDDTLLPDVEQLLPAASELVRDGFIVLAYTNDDPITAMKLQDIGCAAVMPLASPIGSGAGIRNPYNLEIIRARLTVPMIVDAGIGTASDAALAMELGCDAVLLNTAISGAKNPVQMAKAMRLGVEGGRAAYLAGRIPKKLLADPSSPMIGRIKKISV
jgi:thiazole synthase